MLVISPRISPVGLPEPGVGTRQQIATTDETHRPKRVSDRNRGIHNGSFDHAGHLALRMVGSKGVQACRRVVPLSGGRNELRLL